MENAASADSPLWFSMRRADQTNGRIILDKLSRVLNSNQNFMAEGQLKISYIHMEAGGRRTNRALNESLEQWLEREIASGSSYSPDNATDSMCLTRCVAVSVAKESMSKHAFYRVKQPKSVIQRDEAKRLCELAQIDPDTPCGLDEVRKLQDVLNGFRLCVFTDKEGRDCDFKGTYAVISNYLLLHDGYFYT
jgi:hypothetical protein